MAVDALARALAAGKVPVSAYEMAVKAGYTGTEEQFAEDMGNSGTNAENAAASASAAAASAESIADSAAQIATNTNDISDLKTQIDEQTEAITKKMEAVTSSNLFDISTITPNIIVEVNNSITSNTNYNASDYIPVTAGHVLYSYYVNNNNTVYAANMTKVAAYNGNKEIVSASGQNSSAGSYTVPSGIEFVRVTYSSGVGDKYMVLDNVSTMPSAFIPYAKPYYIATEEFIEKALSDAGALTGIISKEETDFWQEIQSANLFNPSAVTAGEYYNANGTTQTASSLSRELVPLQGAGTYSFFVAGQWFGLTTALNIPCFDAAGNYIKYITATTTETTASRHNQVTLTISAQDVSDGVKCIGYTVYNSELSDAMIVKSATYPEEYVPYYKYWSIIGLDNVEANPLFGKKAVFDGDSICAGNGSAMGDYGNGWAGRVGVDNSMIYYNVGVGGACITAETYFDNDTSRPRHWISRYIDTIYANYPDADYIILEGGTNDADIFYGDAEKLGTFSESDFTGPFDDTTFYGAMDSLCKKAMTYFPKAKIGFIIAQKMGLGFTGYCKNRYDYFGYAKAVCKKWGIPVLNLWDEGQLRPDVISDYDPTYNTIETATAQGLLYYDGQHLTAYGYDVISQKIAAWMKTL